MEKEFKPSGGIGIPMAMETRQVPWGERPGLEGEPCDICGAATYEVRCKVICKQCGYTRDCSDP